MKISIKQKLKKGLRKAETLPVLRRLKPATDNLLRLQGIREEAEKLHGYGCPAVIFGVNKLSLRFHKLLRAGGVKSYLIAFENDRVPAEYAPDLIAAEDLIYLAGDKPAFYSMAPSMDGVVKSRLLELGFRPQSVKRLGFGTLARVRGVRLADGWDPLLGSVRTKDSCIPEYSVFGSDAPGALRILILGGSSSDPTLMNMKSWSEYLYDSLSSMGISAVIYNGAVGGYCSAQEMKKLLRDLRVLCPQLVISLSGVNDAAGIYMQSGHPLYQREDLAAAQWLVKKRKARNGLQDNIPLKTVSFGPEDHRTLFEVWLDNERTMHAACTEFRAEFHAFLQPIKELNSVKTDFYRDAKAFFARSHPQWMHDLSRLFDDDKSVYADFCHLYERGNRRLAAIMLRCVLEHLSARDTQRQH